MNKGTDIHVPAPLGGEVLVGRHLRAGGNFEVIQSSDNVFTDVWRNLKSKVNYAHMHTYVEKNHCEADNCFLGKDFEILAFLFYCYYDKFHVHEIQKAQKHRIVALPAIHYLLNHLLCAITAIGVEDSTVKRPV